jgi:hypothetical protein
MLGLATLAQRRPVSCALLGAAAVLRGGTYLYNALWSLRLPRATERSAEVALAESGHRITDALRLAWERGV